MDTIVIKESAVATSLNTRAEDIVAFVKKTLGSNAKVVIAISDVDQKHVDFMQDCGHDSPDDYSVVIHGVEYKIHIESKDKPLPF